MSLLKLSDENPSLNIFPFCLNYDKNNGKLYGFTYVPCLQMLAEKNTREIVMLLAAKQ